jgi:BMFP domain-containing protein YqiC
MNLLVCRQAGHLYYIYQWVKMSLLNSTKLDELARRLAESVPESLRSFGRDLEGNFKAVLQAQLAKLDLVSRQEFDVQAALLARTQEKLAALEQRLQEIEQKQ